jgi:hypothetical protein
MKIAAIIILVFGVGAFLMAKREANESKEEDIKTTQGNISSKKQTIVTPAEFVETIDSLGYFKYAEANNIKKLKESHLESFQSSGSWGGIWDDETNLPLDFRFYSCDGEYVFEQDGFTGMLDELETTFKKIGFKIKIENHFEEWDSENEWLNHIITINGNNYIIFKNFKGYGWGEAAQRLGEILNTEFEIQNIDERVYLINGGNDGFLIFLNDGLYKYFYDTFTNTQWKPLEVKEWAAVMGVKEMKLE